MALDGTYTGLLASMASWLHRPDMTTIAPDLVVLAEARIARDLRLRRQVTGTTLFTIATTQAVALPSDFLEMENLSLTAGGIDRSLEYVNIERMNLNYPSGSGDGEPKVYTFEGSNILFGPRPDAVYSVPIYYYARLAALTVTPTNWLLTNHPNIYLFGALAEAGDWAQDDANVAKWEKKYQAGINELSVTDDESMFSGAALRVRSK